MTNKTNRYSRHLALPGFTEASQEAIGAARILIVGCGGLGHPVLQYLVAAGVGEIGIVDDDKVQLSNLQRQTLFNEDDLGKLKVSVAAGKLRRSNSQVHIREYAVRINPLNILEIFRPFQMVVDCTDNFATRYLIDDACSILKMPLISGALYRYEGQVSLFHGKAGVRYRDLHPSPPSAGTIPDCETGGVLGSLAGVIGSIQATEALKYITGIGTTLDGKLLILDLRNLQTDIIELKAGSIPRSTALQDDYESNCENGTSKDPVMLEISCAEFENLCSSGSPYQLIDVREKYEYEAGNIGGILIPMNDIPQQMERIEREIPVVIYCKAGVRSAHVIHYLNQTHGFKNLYNLRGGILEWQKTNGLKDNR